MVFKRSLDKLKAGLRKTRDILLMDVRDIVRKGRKIDRAFLDDLEEWLLGADVGVIAAQHVLDRLSEAWYGREIDKKDAETLMAFVKEALVENLTVRDGTIAIAETPPTVILVAGVNGSGKTTSIAKLAHHYQNVEGKQVLLAASDTFRAAAVEQLTIWAERIGCDIVKHQSGSDPAAVAFDAVEAAVARGAQVLIVDTAGRLHTQSNLMKELEKISRVLSKKVPDAPHEVLLVLDGTTGQNAVAQAREFSEVLPVSGIFLSKLDGTAKGGVVLAIARELDIPVKFIGLGEQVEDVQPFDPDSFVDALFSEMGG